ncbi:MAG: gamma-glutamyl-gamma-aminobutyrate hydrolase family protein, partial [Actinobacteria bacterium]|nr:gamma-glutamyl-gamma-aminobutyrate hydrolase family protein [Actinomycetota bacterium]
AGFYNERPLDISWIASDDLKGADLESTLGGLDGILVPGGFGVRGIEGKIAAIRHAREHLIPFFGICLGLQCAVIEFARNVAGLDGANSSEFETQTPYPVVDVLVGQDLSALGGTMRLGAYPCRLSPGSKAARAYDAELVFERHRHRYEVNPRFRRRLEDAGLKCSGESPDSTLVEIIELEDHPWFVAGQFHPEFRSRPDRPHPLFREFVGAAAARSLSRQSVSEPARGPLV